jgi:predicted RNA-binding protein YlxR (DUF448 family)
MAEFNFPDPPEQLTAGRYTEVQWGYKDQIGPIDKVGRMYERDCKDIATAEVLQLRARIEQLQAELAAQTTLSRGAYLDNQRLSAENAELREALQLAIADIDSWHQALEPATGAVDSSLLPRLRAALSARDSNPERSSPR